MINLSEGGIIKERKEYRMFNARYYVPTYSTFANKEGVNIGFLPFFCLVDRCLDNTIKAFPAI